MGARSRREEETRRRAEERRRPGFNTDAGERRGDDSLLDYRKTPLKEVRDRLGLHRTAGGLTHGSKLPKGAQATGSTPLWGRKWSSVEKIFVNENREPEYVGMRMGPLGTKSTPIPMGFVEIDEEFRTLVLE